jgi:RNA polymerase sigma-70 factor (ECF subfamily)
MNLFSSVAIPAHGTAFAGSRGIAPGSRSRVVRSALNEAVLYSSPSPGTRRALQFHLFDASYVEKLCAGDKGTQDHFAAYFTSLLQIKLRSRLRSPQAIEDVCQETFARVFATLRRDGGLRQPERLGAFVNSTCNNILFEQYRAMGRNDSLDDENSPEPVDKGRTALEIVASRQEADKVREILRDLPQRDRDLLKAVFLDEHDRDEVCAKFGVDREYLRVLLHRAKQGFKTEYMKRLGDPTLLGARA